MKRCPCNQCGKTYASHQSLCNHKRRCTGRKDEAREQINSAQHPMELKKSEISDLINKISNKSTQTPCLRSLTTSKEKKTIQKVDISRKDDITDTDEDANDADDDNEDDDEERDADVDGDNVDEDEDENEDEDEESCNNGKSSNKPNYWLPGMNYHYGIDAMIAMDKVRGIKRGIRVKNKSFRR